MVRRMGAAADAEKRLALGFLVSVQEHGLQPGCIPAREYRILSTGLISRGIFIIPVSRRHGTLILFDTSPHFSQQVIPKINIITRPGSRMVVLCFQVSSNFRVKLGWVAHHVLPVFILEPGIVIESILAVMSKYLRAFLGNWGVHSRLNVASKTGPSSRASRGGHGNVLASDTR